MAFAFYQEMNYKTKPLFILSALLLIQSVFADGGFYFTTLSVNVSPATEEDSPMWYFDSPDYFSAERYWNNPETPVEKRLAVFEHVSDRLAYIFYSCPKLEEKIDFKIEEVSLNELISKIEESIDYKIPHKLDVPDDFTVSVTVAGYRAFEVVESVCAQGGLEMEFTNELMSIRKKK